MVLRGHLEELQAALFAATNYHAADDLARKFKNVGGTHQPANLTTRLEHALDRVEGYLKEDTDVPEEQPV